ncbi:MAG TPA: hypothetical protein VFO14_25820 [Vicinamibacterales bacterium]|nr:hypothetical protein [Vicinamibacterales bacterium]
MYNVGQVLSTGFGRSWHEAVAIVQECAHQLQPGFSLPAAEDIHLDEVGTLTFGFGDESSDNPVAALAALLDSLLNGVEAPSSLRDLVRENAGRNPAHSNVASFSQALSFFERPNRVNDIRAVAGRLRGFREANSAEQEFARLREKVAKAGEPEEDKTEKKEKKVRQEPRLSRRQQAAVVALVALALFGTLGFRAGLHHNVGVIAGTLEGGVQDVVSAGLEQLGVSKAPSATSDSPDPAAKPPAPEPVEAGRPSRGEGKPIVRQKTTSEAKISERSGTFEPGTPRSTSGTGAAGRPSVAQPASDHRPDRGFPALSPVVPPLPVRPSEVATTITPSALPAPAPKIAAPRAPARPAPDEVFSSENPEVQAPVLVRPQLPKKPAPGDDTGIFEMIVDENGDVALVNLISPRRDFHDRMLVAAAKAWKFKPATLDGQPVKYRIRIPIILTEMPGRS